MYSAFTLSLKYLHYLLTAANGKGHGIHSPFVYDFVRNVLNDKTDYPEFGPIERLRHRLLRNHTPIPIEDYGAGSASSVSGAASKSIAAITRHSSKSSKYAQLLFRMVRYYQPHYVVELGTSVGLSAAYLASGSDSSVVLTGEGNDALAMLARRNLQSLQIDRVQVVTGNFDNTLPVMAGSIPQVDFAFIDGNHRKVPTLKYFGELQARSSADAILVFDDIHWSEEMEEAWMEIKNHPSVLLTIDLFFLGIVFFKPEFKVKQHFTIRF